MHCTICSISTLSHSPSVASSNTSPWSSVTTYSSASPALQTAHRHTRDKTYETEVVGWFSCLVIHLSPFPLSLCPNLHIWNGKLNPCCCSVDRRMLWPPRTTAKPESPKLATLSCPLIPSTTARHAVLLPAPDTWHRGGKYEGRLEIGR